MQTDSYNMATNMQHKCEGGGALTTGCAPTPWCFLCPCTDIWKSVNSCGLVVDSAASVVLWPPHWLAHTSLQIGLLHPKWLLSYPRNSPQNCALLWLSSQPDKCGYSARLCIPPGPMNYFVLSALSLPRLLEVMNDCLGCISWPCPFVDKPSPVLKSMNTAN